MYVTRSFISDKLARPPSPELLLGRNALLPFDFLRTGDCRGRAVVKVVRHDGVSGTGFLVGPGVLLTNHHVLPTPLVAAGATATANYEADPPTDPAGRVAVVPLRPADLFLTDHELDFTFCGVRGLDFVGAIKLDRPGFHVDVGEYVNVIQHPRGGPKCVTLQDNRVVEIDPLFVRYSCDTEPGSSGSPVFNNRWQLVAIHHASVLLDRARLEGDTTYCDSLMVNEGVALGSISLWLDALASSATPPLHVGRLCALFEGIDPRVGFFGALGYTPDKGGPGPFVSQCVRGLPRHLDLGYWNLVDLAMTNPTVFDRTLQAIALMRLDVWCLTMTMPGLGEQICRALEDRFDLEMKLHEVRLTDGRDGPIVALLSHVERRFDITSERVGSVERGALAHFRISSSQLPEHAVQVFVDTFPRGARRPGAGWPSAGNVPRAAGDEPVLLTLCAHLDPTVDASVLLSDTCIPAHSVVHGWHVMSALGPGGSLGLLQNTCAGPERIVLSPNLLPAEGHSPVVLQAIDRELPGVLCHTQLTEPIAARLVFAAKTHDPAGVLP